VKPLRKRFRRAGVPGGGNVRMGNNFRASAGPRVGAPAVRYGGNVQQFNGGNRYAGGGARYYRRGGNGFIPGAVAGAVVGGAIASQAYGYYGGYDDGYGYDANYGYDNGYYYGDGGCYVVQRQVMTPYGWSVQPVQVCN